MASLQILNFRAQQYCHDHSARLHGFCRGNGSSICCDKRLSVRVRSEKRGYNDSSSVCEDQSTGDKKNSNNNINNNKFKILIAGGGIGGLVFALAAKRSGFDVTVFEKDLTAVRGEGRDRGPIQLLSSALGLLENIDRDIVREISEAGYVTGDRTNGLADGRTGNWFARFDFLTPALQKGIPVTQIICRMELQRLLLNAVGEDLVINNSKVVDFVNDPNKVTVLLENGEKYEGDLLIGADGLRSMPKYKIFIGRNQYFVALDIGKGRMQWYAFAKEARDSPTPSAGNKNKLLDKLGDWCEEVITIILNTEEHMIIRRPIDDIDMLSTWGKGRVVLLGDAAHAMLPNLGQGGSMAIEDCYWLMVELRNLAERNPFSAISSDALAQAFRRFEKKRMFRVGTVHSICRIASVLTSVYQTYFNIGPLPIFNLSALKVKHPSLVISSTLLRFVLPKFMDWVVVGQE
ncbi:hypothetical protein OROHE_005374 [Orobanche hederae]